MNKTRDFLLEIGSEELPPGQLKNLACLLANNIEKNIKKLSLNYEKIRFFYTPQRITIYINNLDVQQKNQKIDVKGPSLKVSLDDNRNPNNVAIMFAKKCGVDFTQLEILKIKNEKFLSFSKNISGKMTIELLPDIINISIKNIHLAKMMYWETMIGPFPRPVHWILAIFGKQIVPLSIFGISASNKTKGHRFYYPNYIKINNIKKYEDILQNKAMVIVDANKRRKLIINQIQNLIHTNKVLLTDDLLEINTNITEWPTVLLGHFDKKFLCLPDEIITTTLEHHQRCIPIYDNKNLMLPQFIIISNIKNDDVTQIIKGNERVINARLTDAKYFYDKDKKVDFREYINKLKSITYQTELGTLYDKMIRLKELIKFISIKTNINIDNAVRAAELSKCDLVSSVVCEFPELQGIMGYYYTKNNEETSISLAIKEHYLPKFSDDKVPSTMIGCALALADKIDHLSSFFFIGKKPSGTKDPFGLRRAAYGIIKILLDKKLSLNIHKLIEISFLELNRFNKNKYLLKNIINEITEFLYERFKTSYIEQGGDINIFRAVFVKKPFDFYNAKKMLSSIESFYKTQEFISLISVYKRINNILIDINYDARLFIYNNEIEVNKNVIQLHQEIKLKKDLIINFYEKTEYNKLILELIGFSSKINYFFENVTILDKKENIKNNRLAILFLLKDLFTLAFDFSLLL